MRLRDLQAARAEGRRVAMLTCYDHTSAVHLQQAGVEMLLVGDSAAGVILGHDRTTGVTLPFLIQLAAAVRRGAHNSHVMADMPFGSYHGSRGRAVRNVCKVVAETGCDSVKMEVSRRQLELVAECADAGVAVCAHLGLRPQHVQRTGYSVQAKTRAEAEQLAEDAAAFEAAGAAMVLIEAVPPQAAQMVVEATTLPVIGCGAGSAPMGHVVVLQDLLGLTPRRPKFVPDLGQPSLRQAAETWVQMVRDGSYPEAEHVYEGEFDA